ncbi:MAG: flavin reductase family protein [Actinobacteria bacterium]|nr:flavin reductase family protein [Actinomycetota bacterium]
MTDSAMHGAPGVPLHPDHFRHVIGHFASGVAVITVRQGGEAFGTTASAVSSLSVEPPMLLVCLNRSSLTGRAVESVGSFVVNILAVHQAEIARRFARRGSDFSEVATEDGANGAPVILDALASLECRVTEEVVGGTHKVFIAAVERASAAPEGAPLAYFRGTFGRLEDGALPEEV